MAMLNIFVMEDEKEMFRIICIERHEILITLVQDLFSALTTELESQFILSNFNFNQRLQKIPGKDSHKQPVQPD